MLPSSNEFVTPHGVSKMLYLERALEVMVVSGVLVGFVFASAGIGA